MNYYQNDAPAVHCVVISKSCGHRTKVASDRTIRILTGDVDWAIKIMGYLGVRTYRALVGVRIEVCSGGSGTPSNPCSGLSCIIDGLHLG